MTTVSTTEDGWTNQSCSLWQKARLEPGQADALCTEEVPAQLAAAVQSAAAVAQGRVQKLIRQLQRTWH
ncbi:hypothetical protein CVIRNUC_008322 [Coccomyxa viridis]|uniref:Uncharacterized protein n=1 Tax=Coccomyxa viridis TaxID=1274662 RepID=A0AAV1ICM2_9CHLO|nr:hypothetical protein CVIRNUC_008320 [Coccomyxa viridis]CAK0785116.1 hypothetical protein CVIRNUC_008322 [Coccomyxa viridis]